MNDVRAGFPGLDPRGWDAEGRSWTDPDLDEDGRAAIAEALASRNFFLDFATFEDWLAYRRFMAIQNSWTRDRRALNESLKAAERERLQGAASVRRVEVRGRAKGRRKPPPLGPGMF